MRGESVRSLAAIATALALVQSPGVLGAHGPQGRFPATSGIDADGRLLVLPAPEGWTVVVFWASWCRPCMRHLGDYDLLWRDLRDRGVRVAGVGVDVAPAVFRDTIRRHGVGFPCLNDPRGRLLEALGVEGLPLAVVLDPDGRVRLAVQGDPDDLVRIRALVSSNHDMTGTRMPPGAGSNP